MEETQTPVTAEEDLEILEETQALQEECPEESQEMIPEDYQKTPQDELQENDTEEFPEETQEDAGETPESIENAKSASDSTLKKVSDGINIALKWIYRLRKIIMAAPVVYYALRLAAYNSANLPETVGVNLLPSGAFAMEISRQAAIAGPLALTAACLLLMFCSRKVMYAWAISIFSLALPVLLLVSNLYPA